MHADDVILNGLQSYLQNISGLEDHVTLDEDQIPAEGEAPWAWLQLGDEDIQSQTLSGKKTRGLFINIDLVTAARFGPMRQANELAAVIENRIDADPRLGGLVGKAALQSLTRARDTSSNFARLRMIYLVTFWTAAGAAQTPI